MDLKTCIGSVKCMYALMQHHNCCGFEGGVVYLSSAVRAKTLDLAGLNVIDRPDYVYRCCYVFYKNSNATSVLRQCMCASRRVGTTM